MSIVLFDFHQVFLVIVTWFYDFNIAFNYIFMFAGIRMIGAIILCYPVAHGISQASSFQESYIMAQRLLESMRSTWTT